MVPNYKEFEAIFLSKPMRLPYMVVDDQKTFLHYFKIKMRRYYQTLENVPDDQLPGDQSKEYYLERMLYFIEGLQNTLELYLQGFPAKAYSKFKVIIEESHLDVTLTNLRTVVTNANSSFYRVKKEYDSSTKPFKGKSNGMYPYRNGLDLFHVPFEKRKSVPTNRFSIPGFPCLYLSSSLHTSWSECMLENKHAFHAIRYTNHRPLYFIDMVPLFHALKSKTVPAKLEREIYSGLDQRLVLQDFSFIFPLIFACHTKYKYIDSYTGETKFKSEYIIPQLLLQWYQEKGITIDGIRYFSCTAEQNFPQSKSSKYNYVLPVKASSCIKENGYCDRLLDNFSASEVYTYLARPLKKRSEANIEHIAKILDSSKVTPLST